SEPDSDGGSSGTSNAGTANAGTPNAGTSNAGSSGIAGSGAGSSAAGGGAGGSGGSGQAGSAGSSATTGCTGDFGTPVLLFSGASNAIPQSLSVTGDDLELYYQENRTETQHLFVRKRTSRDASFGAPTELSPALFDWCPTPVTTPNIDVSDDGLRLYITCNPDMTDAGALYPPGPIRLATRPDRNTDFALLPDTLGTAWMSVSVSPDELTVVSTDLADIEQPKTMLGVRASRDLPFDPAIEVTGDDDPFRHPELVGDAFTLFGSWENNGTYPARIAVRTRPVLEPRFGASEPAGVPVPAEMPMVTVSDLTPTLSADCRSLYFLRMTQTDPNGYAFDVYAARR
ncbi:MAG TPA: hypothetical protein VGK73_34935, partial [Polyangiaceae bacterium]